MEELKRLVTERANDGKKVNTLLDRTSQRYGSQPDVSIGCSRKVKFFKEVAVLFTDFKQFSFVAEGIPAEYRVRSLDYFFKKFDCITEKHHRVKIKTIGHAYIGAGGHLTENTAHAKNAFSAVLEILKFVKNTKDNPPKGIDLFEVSIGINAGPAVAGVVGTKKF